MRAWLTPVMSQVEFILMPMPRLEVETVADLKVLFEIGALTPDLSLQMSQILMGDDVNNKRRRTELMRGNQAKQDQGEMSRDDVEGLKRGDETGAKGAKTKASADKPRPSKPPSK